MVKTRIQTASAPIKEEECKNTPNLNNASITTRKRSKITKNSASKRKDNVFPVCDVKVEEETDTKSLLKPIPWRKIVPVVTEEQVKQLIDYAFNQGMSVRAASKKVNVSHVTGSKYAIRYRMDPIKNPYELLNTNSQPTYYDIKTFIGYIVDDGMSINEAARTLNIPVSTGRNYYIKYRDDPSHNIPLPHQNGKTRNSVYTQDQVKILLQCIVHDNMSVELTAAKINIGISSARKYYKQYLQDSSHKVPVQRKTTNSFTQEQIDTLIHYIVNDKMTIGQASMKVNMSRRTGGDYYQRYMNDPNSNIPVPRTRTPGMRKVCTQEQVNEFIGYITQDNMSIHSASLKANISVSAAGKYYALYLKDPDRKIPVPSKTFGYTKKRFTPEQISDLIGFIVNDRLSLRDAAKKINMSEKNARTYYNRYIYDPNHRIPIPQTSSGKKCTKEKVAEIIGCLVDDKMTLTATSAKLNMSLSTVKNHYMRYLNGQANTKKTKVKQRSS